jgi:O-antigen/teichoic acid export membrane protein
MATRSLRSIGLIWAGAMSSAVFAFGAQVVLARHYGVTDVGFLVTAMAITNLAVPVALMGTHWFLMDPRMRANGLSWQPRLDRIFVTALPIGAGVAAGVSHALGLPTAAALAAASMVLCVAMVERAISRFQFAQSFTRVSAAQPVSYGTRLAAIGLAAMLALDAETMWLAVAVGQGLGVVLLHRWSATPLAFDPPVPAAPRASFAQTLGELLPLVGMAFTAICFTQIDRLIVTARQGPVAAGLYGTAASLLLLAEILPGAAASRFLLARLSLLGSDQALRRRMALRIAGLALGAGMLAATAAALLGPWALTLLFGPAFAPAGAVIVVLAWYLPGRFVSLALSPFCVDASLKKGKLLLDAVALAGLVPALWWAAGAESVATVAVARSVGEAVLAAALVGWVVVGGRGRGSRSPVL